MDNQSKAQAILDKFEVGDCVVLNHDNEHDHKFTIKSKTVSPEGEALITIIRYCYIGEAQGSGLMKFTEDARLFTKLSQTAKSEPTLPVPMGNDLVEEGLLKSGLGKLGESVEGTDNGTV